MKLVAIIVFWAIGAAVAALGNRKLREYKCYSKPRLFLALGILLCIGMSWAMVWYLLMEGEYRLPLKLYHSCMDFSEITYEEEYLDGNGNPTDPKVCKTHNTYRIYTCSRCGKQIKKKLL